MGEEKTLKILTHVFGLLTGILGPLIILVLANDKDVKKHAKNSFNWQLTLLILVMIPGILSVIIIGKILIAVLTVINVLFCIKAAVMAWKNKFWKYPLSIRFFKL